MDTGGKILGLLPYNPESPIDPAKQAVIEYGVSGGRVRLLVAKYYGFEAHGGFLTPGDAETLGYSLIRLADVARQAAGGGGA